MKKYFLCAVLFALPLQGWANRFESLEMAVSSSQDVETKSRALLELSEAYRGSGDLARALNQLELIRSTSSEIEDQDLIDAVETEFWAVSRAFNAPTASSREAAAIARDTRAAKKLAEENRRLQANQKPVFRLTPEKKSWVSQQVDGYKSLWAKGRPPLKRKLSPLSMGQLNGLNTIVGIPDVESAYLLPVDGHWSFDFKLDFGNYKEDVVTGLQQLKVDTSITRALLEVTVPLSKMIGSKVNYPVDIKIGIPAIQWSNLPYFTFDTGAPATALLLSGQKGSASLGDIFIDTKVAFYSDERSAWSGKLRINTPTGSTSDLTGTGSLGTALSLLYSRSLLTNFAMNMNIGMMYAGDAENFNSNSGKVAMADVIFAGADLSYRFFNDHYLILNGDFHENAFKGYTKISVLESSPTSVGLGYAKNFSRNRFFFGYKVGLNGASADNSLMFSFKQLR
jgi:hypothetical protein